MEHFLNETTIVALAFILFIPVVYKRAKHAVIEMLDNRTAQVVKSLQESERIFKDAQALLNDAKLKHQEAEETIRLMVIQAENEARSLIADAKRQAEEITNKKIEISLAKINLQEKQLIEDIKLAAIQQAMTKVEESLINELDKEAQLSLIEDGLKQVKKLMH